MQRLFQRQPMATFIGDAVAWALALVAAELMRYDFDTGSLDASGLGLAVVIVAVLLASIGLPAGLYRRRWRIGSLEETIALAFVSTAVGSLLSIIVWAGDSQLMPRSVPAIATGISIVGSVAFRSIWRLQREKLIRPVSGERIVVLGAGEAAYQIVRTLNTSSDGRFKPVALLDDDPMKRRLQFEGLKVEGTLDQLPEVARARGCRTALLAISRADSELIRRVNEISRQADIRLLVLPPVHQLFGAVTPADIRPVSEVDLLGRQEASIDTAAVRDFITGRRVLVTGAGGSIGSELCRQLAAFQPSALMMLDRDESGLHGVQLSIEGRALLDDPNLLLADIRDADRIKQIFRACRPEVVFHAAALKHLPLLEAAPEEAWKTNVLGTLHVLEAADEVGVTHFVNISTDKAADPTSVLGSSKRITERLTSHRAHVTAADFVSVRFGNVLGSRGSVLTIFRAQADLGGPLTVTHPDVTRYFMTVQEAVRLTIYAGAIGRGGEVMVLDMGEPVRIADVAERFAQQHTPPLTIEFTGLRPGEKMHEDLVAVDEEGDRRVHGLISHVVVPPLSLAEFRDEFLAERTVTKETLMLIARADMLDVAS